MKRIQRLYVQTAGSSVKFCDRETVFALYNRRRVQRPANVDGQIALVAHALDTDTFTIVGRLVTERERENHGRN